MYLNVPIPCKKKKGVNVRHIGYVSVLKGKDILVVNSKAFKLASVKELSLGAEKTLRERENEFCSKQFSHIVSPPPHYQRLILTFLE